MLIRDIKDADYFRAGDNCLLCELLHPKDEKDYGDLKLQMGYSIVHAIVPTGEKTIPHMLKESSEVYYILAGKGQMHIDSEVSEMSSGQVVYIPPGSVQYIENRGDCDLVFLAMVSPEWREEDEVVFGE
ncbi:cupin domain-containing protein [Methanoplanus sp. FWC-SCC4]|uniref:Cupin domain-containing protein n=1 Tax=Methanochimaera problematica TaxID=2609417 RepID=A0AA97I556_9EURY|nr:cupin domain-containing protein [Methanoplanus sp. FWC-SCC4]WOF17129.1 cupin domain-containing protein [Methanoplanus sp. FWC-SCC4]